MSDELLLPHEEAKGERHLSERTAAVRHTRLDRLDNFFKREYRLALLHL